MKKEQPDLQRVLMATAMVFTMAGHGSSKDADTSAKERDKDKRILRIRKIPDKQFIVDLMRNILHTDIKMTMVNM